jgi:hypothetical protein
MQSKCTAYMINSLVNGGSSLTEWVMDTTNPTVIAGVKGSVPTNSYSAPPPAEQAGTSVPITMWNTRLSNAVHQPDSGLWTTNTVACTPPGDTQRACVQWYQIDPGSFTIRQQGLTQLPGYHFYSPAIAANDQGDAVLTFNGSNANLPVEMYFTGHYRTDPPNTMTHVVYFNTNGGCFVPANGLNSLSTHSDAVIDPIDSSVFWIYGAYTFGNSATCQDNDWGTNVAAVQFVGGTAVTQSSKVNTSGK